MSVCICYSAISKLFLHKQLNGGIIQCFMSLFINTVPRNTNVCPHARDTLQQIINKKVYMQFYESSHLLLARKSTIYLKREQYQNLGIILYLYANTIPIFGCFFLIFINAKSLLMKSFHYRITILVLVMTHFYLLS